MTRQDDGQQRGCTVIARPLSISFASNLGNASNHDNTNLPMILAGGGYKHAGHIAHDRQNNAFLSNLYKFGASTGVIRGSTLVME